MGINPGDLDPFFFGLGLGPVERTLVDVDADGDSRRCAEDAGEPALTASHVEHGLALERKELTGDLHIGRIARLLPFGHSSSFSVVAIGRCGTEAFPGRRSAA